MSHDEKRRGLPSYEDSVATSNRSQTSTIPTPFPSGGRTIRDNLTLVRAQHIRSVIDEAIIPVIEQQAMYGLAQTVIAMIPSDVPLPTSESEKSEYSFDPGHERKVEVVGFSSGDDSHIIQLEGQLNKTDFWRPVAIVHELEQVLQERLNASFHLQAPISKQEDTLPEAPVKQPRKHILGRRSERKLSSGTTQVGLHQQPPNTGQALVKVRLEEICLRTVNDFGLYDTLSKQCIIVKVDVQC